MAKTNVFPLKRYFKARGVFSSPGAVAHIAPNPQDGQQPGAESSFKPQDKVHENPEWCHGLLGEEGRELQVYEEGCGWGCPTCGGSFPHQAHGG